MTTNLNIYRRDMVVNCSWLHPQASYQHIFDYLQVFQSISIERTWFSIVSNIKGVVFKDVPYRMWVILVIKLVTIWATPSKKPVDMGTPLRTQLRWNFLKKQLYSHSERPYWVSDTFLDRKIKFQNFLKISIFILCLCVKLESRWPYSLFRAL